jgi:hypothetical protein
MIAERQHQKLYEFMCMLSSIAHTYGTLSRSLVRKYVKHHISSDGGTWYPLQAGKFLNIRHYINSSYEKSIIEITIQYIKGRTESFDDYFSCTIERCKLQDT